MLDSICTPQEVLYIANALLPREDLDRKPLRDIYSLFKNGKGLVVLAKLVEQLVKASQ